VLYERILSIFLLTLQKTEDEPTEPEPECSVRPVGVTNDTRVTPCSILLDTREVL
jgi:hypothetical protein